MNTPYDVHDGPNDIPVCPICGSENVDWVDCPECGGDGGFHGDEVDPDLGHNDFVRCEMCRGDGGWWQCYESARHVETKQEARG